MSVKYAVGKIPLPTHCRSRYVRDMIVAANAREITLKQLAIDAGVPGSTILHWRDHGREPGINSLVACFNALGLDLVIVPLNGAQE